MKEEDEEVDAVAQGKRWRESAAKGVSIWKNQN